MSSPGLVRLDTECDGCHLKTQASAGNVNDGQRQLTDRGWMRNDKLDLDLCPSCAQVRVGYFVDRRLL